MESALKRLDGDGDISAGEVFARVEAWQDSRVGRMSASCIVLLAGRPLADANVTLEPEKFLGNKAPRSIATSNEAGIDILQVESAATTNLPGVPGGLYLGRISKLDNGKEVVSDRYHVDTTLAEEIALDAASVKSDMMRFEVTAP